MDIFVRVPFLRLLLSLVLGILVQTYFIQTYRWSVIPLLFGIGIMFFSYLVKAQKSFSSRWLFGIGVILFFFSVGVFSTALRQHQSSYSFLPVHQSYKAVIIDIPQEKANNIVQYVRLDDSGKKIICYFPLNNKGAQELEVGDIFEFWGEIKPFKFIETDRGFNYGEYMFNKGYAGFVFVSNNRWEKTGEIRSNLFIEALKIKKQLLTFYKLLDLNQHEQSILAAITLGYTDYLPDNLISSFRITGTAHVLAVSGMHVGIIYAVLLSLLSFIPDHSRFTWTKYLLIIIALWIYTFMVGFPSSSIRAAVMLTCICVSQIAGLRNYSYNSLAVAAFLMLVWNPLQLFDVSFQLSFTAVLFMSILGPVFFKRIKIKSLFARYITNIFVMSVSAQVGLLPLCLYYFGAFPSYFFIANVLIIPLISVIFYCAISIITVHGLVSVPYFFFLKPVENTFILVYQMVAEILVHTVIFFEKLPLSQLVGLRISIVEIFLLFGILVGSIWFLMNPLPKKIICVLTLVLGWLVLQLHTMASTKDSLIIYYNLKHSQVECRLGYKGMVLTDSDRLNLLSINDKSYLQVSEDRWKTKMSSEKWRVDYLHITGEKAVSLYSLHRVFDMKHVVLDASLSKISIRRLIEECEKLRIPYYDVSENGTLRIFF